MPRSRLQSATGALHIAAMLCTWQIEHIWLPGRCQRPVVMVMVKVLLSFLHEDIKGVTFCGILMFVHAAWSGGLPSCVGVYIVYTLTSFSKFINTGRLGLHMTSIHSHL